MRASLLHFTGFRPGAPGSTFSGGFRDVHRASGPWGFRASGLGFRV